MSNTNEARTPGNVYTVYEQDLINAHVDLCLIHLVRDYGNLVGDFDDNLRDTAVTRSLDFMEGYIQAFESHLDYLSSYEHVSQRYEKLTGSMAVAPLTDSVPLRAVDDG